MPPARPLILLLLTLAWLPGLAVGAAADELVLATWNMEHLAARNGDGCRPRSAADYTRLAAEAARIGADVIALQEVEDARAAARVFDPGTWQLVFSAQPAPRADTCRERPGQRRTPQRTGFAIHRARLAALGLRWRQLPPFTALGESGGRWGTRIVILPIGDDQTTGLELLAVHLKSGCAWDRLDRAGRGNDQEACDTLRRQRGILEEWLDGRAAAGAPFVVLGDFNRQLDQRNDDLWRAIDDASVCTWRPDADQGRVCKPDSERPNAGADLTLAGAGQPFPFAHNPRFPHAIDHFVLGGGAAAWLVAGSYAALPYQSDPAPSDHHPLRIRLRLPWATAR